MGSVYRALRRDDFEKPVAIKLLASGLASEDMVRRFHAERQILARLEHPGAAVAAAVERRQAPLPRQVGTGSSRAK